MVRHSGGKTGRHGTDVRMSSDSITLCHHGSSVAGHSSVSGGLSLRERGDFDDSERIDLFEFISPSQVAWGLADTLALRQDSSPLGRPSLAEKKGIHRDGPTDTTQILNLQPGELVRVKPYEQILRTLNKIVQNRGMFFDQEMVRYCGGEYRVRKRVSKIIDEKTGKLQEMKNPCIVLDSVVCQSRFSNCRLFCPRSIYPYWREIWLERVSDSATAVGEPSGYQTPGLNERTVPSGSRQTASGTSRVK